MLVPRRACCSEQQRLGPVQQRRRAQVQVLLLLLSCLLSAQPMTASSEALSLQARGSLASRSRLLPGLARGPKEQQALGCVPARPLKERTLGKQHSMLEGTLMERWSILHEPQ
jgi:hypothetical protein